MHKLKVTLFDVNVGGESHTILEMPNDIVWNEAWTKKKPSTFNLVMVDVSGSMHNYWDILIKSWNKHLSPVLKEPMNCTQIFVFGTDVHFRRTGTLLEQRDLLSESTNLTGAISTINSKINAAKEKFIRLFLITDGHHNATAVSPDMEIAKLRIPRGKTIEVYLLGLGCSFPVEYSLTIRSALHNGNANIPSLFWSRDNSSEDLVTSIEEQILSMTEEIRRQIIKLKMPPGGQLAPGFPETDTAHLGEFIYFPFPPNEVMSALNLLVEKELYLSPESIIMQADHHCLQEKVFRQWNSVIIQQHRMEGKVPTKAFEVMEAIYNNLHEKSLTDLQSIDKSSLKYRLMKKDIKCLEVEFATLMNQSKTIIGLEGQYSSEMELAEKILKTTVKSKYDMKNLKMRGHRMEDYTKDMKEFSEVYEKIKEEVMSLPEPSIDDCCRVTMESIVKDLQDPSFPDLLQEDKFTFMKTFTITGIPIYAPVKDSSQINAWTLCIKNILNSPFTIVSQSTLELCAEVRNFSSESANKEVYLIEGDESSKFNAIVPVFVPEVAKVLSPLMKTNIFAMLSTFCILKNPHIIDHNAHIAALGCTWMKVIMDYPVCNRPEFVVNRLSLIEETGKMYLDRRSLRNYLQILISEPHQALMTESEIYEKKNIKCESLIKPLFLLYLIRDKKIVLEKLLTILPLLILEFIGRCLSNYNQDSSIECIYSHLFVPELRSNEKRKKWLDVKLEDTCNKILESFIQNKGKLFQTYFKLEDLRKNLKSYCRDELKQLQDSVFKISVKQGMANHLKNTGSAGNIKLNSLKTFAQEMKLDENTIQTAFKEKKIFVCVLHSLQNKTSKRRLNEPLPTYDESLKKLKKLVAAENNKKFNAMAMKKILVKAEKMWRKEFMSVHKSEVVQPLTREEVMYNASERGFHVTADNFDKVFRHNPKTGLLRNACMVKLCPFYLQPNKTFNQHISVERQKGFVHQLHQITLEVASKGGTTNDVIQTLLKCSYRRQNGLKIPLNPPSSRVQSVERQIPRLITEYKAFV